MEPLYVFEGYTIDQPWVIVLALAHDYECLREVPSDETNGIGVCDVGDQYGRGTRSSYALANWIRFQGYRPDPCPGPMAGARLLIPPAIAAGLVELGKQESLVSPYFGSCVRLVGVTTDMPLVSTKPICFGADEFCSSCQICTQACPPGAIAPNKKMVRGVKRWYVNFDKSIPFFVKASCGICIAECPWTRPSVRPKLLNTMAQERSIGYPGWGVLSAPFTGVMVSSAPIVPYTFSLFLDPLHAAFGWKQEAMGGAFALGAIRYLWRVRW